MKRFNLNQISSQFRMKSLLKQSTIQFNSMIVNKNKITFSLKDSKVLPRKNTLFNGLVLKNMTDSGTVFGHESQVFSFLEEAKQFFNLCEKGKGWEACKIYCAPNPQFECDALPFNTIQDYTNWMADIIKGPIPDGNYEMISTTCNESSKTIVFCATFVGHHTGPGGPVEPSNPPKFCRSDYAYIIKFNNNGKIENMKKVWDQLSAFKCLGWPLS